MQTMTSEMSTKEKLDLLLFLADELNVIPTDRFGNDLIYFYDQSGDYYLDKD